MSTNVVAILGTYPSGPMNQPTQVASLFEFRQRFGTSPASGVPESATLYYAVSQFFENSGQACHVVRVADNSAASFAGSRAGKTGLYALDRLKAFNLLAMPGASDKNVLTLAEAYCVERGAFLIVDAPAEAVTPAQISSVVTGGLLPRSSQAALYYPWISIADELNGNKPILVPPSGSVAGIYASTDATKGVWKAPAGVDARLNGVLSLARGLTDSEAANLSSLNVNCLRTFAGIGAVVWGARTLQAAGQSPSAYLYVPIRRFVMNIEQSIQQGTSWAVFEPNGPALWGQVRQSVSGFLTQLFQQGALQGTTPAKAFFVRCDATTMTQSDINQGNLIIEVGVAVLKPAEYVILRFGLKAGKP